MRNVKKANLRERLAKRAETHEAIASVAKRPTKAELVAARVLPEFDVAKLCEASQAAALADASMIDVGRTDELRDRLRKTTPASGLLADPPRNYRIVRRTVLTPNEAYVSRDSDIGRALDTIEHMLDTIRKLMR